MHPFDELAPVEVRRRLARQPIELPSFTDEELAAVTREAVASRFVPGGRLEKLPAEQRHEVTVTGLRCLYARGYASRAEQTASAHDTGGGEPAGRIAVRGALALIHRARRAPASVGTVTLHDGERLFLWVAAGGSEVLAEAAHAGIHRFTLWSRPQLAAWIVTQALADVTTAPDEALIPVGPDSDAWDRLQMAVVAGAPRITIETVHLTADGARGHLSLIDAPHAHIGMSAEPDPGGGDRVTAVAGGAHALAALVAGWLYR